MVELGCGSFATAVYHREGATIALKAVHDEASSDVIAAEFRLIQAAYKAFPGRKAARAAGERGGVVFTCVEPYQLYTSAEFARGMGLQEEELPSVLRRPFYAMERLWKIPRPLARKMLELALLDRATFNFSSHCLCRLYLGVKERRRSRFSRGYRNLPLTQADVTALSECLPPVERVAEAIGTALARIHAIGQDARDVEFVLAGNATDMFETRFVVLDWNQVRLHDNRDVTSCVAAFFDNDPYFPLADDPLFADFRRGYLSEMEGTPLERFGSDFIAAVERESKAHSDRRAARRETKSVTSFEPASAPDPGPGFLPDRFVALVSQPESASVAFIADVKRAIEQKELREGQLRALVETIVLRLPDLRLDAPKLDETAARLCFMAAKAEPEAERLLADRCGIALPMDVDRVREGLARLEFEPDAT